jgi:hypothetical protein
VHPQQHGGKDQPVDPEADVEADVVADGDVVEAGGRDRIKQCDTPGMVGGGVSRDHHADLRCHRTSSAAEDPPRSLVQEVSELSCRPRMSRPPARSAANRTTSHVLTQGPPKCSRINVSSCSGL